MADFVFQLKEYSVWKNFVTGEESKSGGYEHDLGIFKTLEAATNYIEELSNDKLVRALEKGNWAWVDAHPAEPIDLSDLVEKDEYFIKGIMVYDRNTGDVDKIEYHIATRIVKESA